MSDYTIPSAVLKFRIRDYQQKSIVKLDYSQESFNPGNIVVGKMTYSLVDDAPIPFGAYFSVSTSAGHKLPSNPIDVNGVGYFNFKVPDDWAETSIFVTMNIHIGAKQDTKTDIVTVVQKDQLVVEFTGEGGKIVKNVSNRIYLEAFTDQSKSEHADFSGAQLIEKLGSSKGVVIAENISTFFNGRGYFEFTPKSDHEYLVLFKDVEFEINIDDLNEQFKNEYHNSTAEVLIKTSTPVAHYEDKIELSLVNAKPNDKLELMLAFSQKDHILYSQSVILSGAETKISLDASKLKLINGGVISVNLYDTRMTDKRESTNSEWFYYGDAYNNFPYQIVAERLLFLLPSKTLQIKVETDKKAYAPGQEVKYDVTVTDKATGKPVKEDVYVSLSVTDLSAFLQVETKKQPASLVSQVYLEKEVKLTDEYDFANSNEFINFLYQIANNQNDDVKEAQLKIELLLGTQKWRMFLFDPVYKESNNDKFYSSNNKLSVSSVKTHF